MNDLILKLSDQSMVTGWNRNCSECNCVEYDLEKFAESIVYDILNELTNDDSLGEARITTIQRLAERYGVAK